MPPGSADITLMAEQSQIAHTYMFGYLGDHTGDSDLQSYLTFQVTILLSDLNTHTHYTFLAVWKLL